jgi:hypothetical protein
MNRFIIAFLVFSPLVFGDENTYELKSVIEICKDFKIDTRDVKHIQSLLEVHDIKNTPRIYIAVQSSIDLAKRNEIDKGFFYMGSCIERVEAILRRNGIKKSK